MILSDRFPIALIASFAVGASIVIPSSVSAVTLPTYSDFINSFSGTQYAGRQYYSLLFCHKASAEGTIGYHTMFYVSGNSWSYNPSTTTITFSDNPSSPVKITASSITDTGYRFSYDSYSTYPKTMRFGSTSSGGQYTFRAGNFTSVYFPDLGDDEYILDYYVSNVDVTPQFIIEGDIDYSDTWIVNVDMTVGDSPSYVEPDESEPTSPPGGGFELPSDWVADNTVPTEPTFSADWIPDPDTVSSGVSDAADTINSGLLSYADGIRFWMSQLTRLTEIGSIQSIVLLLLFLGLFIYIVWLFKF